MKKITTYREWSGMIIVTLFLSSSNMKVVSSFVVHHNPPYRYPSTIRGGFTLFSSQWPSPSPSQSNEAAADFNVDVVGSPMEMDILEKEVLASTQAKLDVKRIKNAILAADAPQTPTSTQYQTQSQSQATSSSLNPTTTKPNNIVSINIPSQLNIGLAASFTFGLTSLLILHQPLLSLLLSILTFYIATRDPIQDEDLMEGDLTGPVTRIVGRAALGSMERSGPTVRRAAIAAVESIENSGPAVEKVKGVAGEIGGIVGKVWRRGMGRSNDGPDGVIVDVDVTAKEYDPDFGWLQDGKSEVNMEYVMQSRNRDGDVRDRDKQDYDFSGDAGVSYGQNGNLYGRNVPPPEFNQDLELFENLSENGVDIYPPYGGQVSSNANAAATPLTQNYETIASSQINQRYQTIEELLDSSGFNNDNLNSNNINQNNSPNNAPKMQDNDIYTMENLEDLAMQYNVELGGTKAQLMMRLVKARALSMKDVLEYIQEMEP